MCMHSAQCAGISTYENVSGYWICDYANIWMQISKYLNHLKSLFEYVMYSYDRWDETLFAKNFHQIAKKFYNYNYLRC